MQRRRADPKRASFQRQQSAQFMRRSPGCGFGLSGLRRVRTSGKGFAIASKGVGLLRVERQRKEGRLQLPRVASTVRWVQLRLVMNL